MWTCTNDHWVCERLHGFYYGCTDSFIRLAVNNGYLKFGVVGDSVTVSCCTVYSHDSTASTVDFEDDCAHSNLLVKTVYFTICLKYWVWKYHRTNLVHGYHRVTLTGRCIALLPVVGYSNVWRPGGRTLQAAAEKVLVRYKTCSIIPPVAVVTFYQTLEPSKYCALKNEEKLYLYRTEGFFNTKIPPSATARYHSTYWRTGIPDSTWDSIIFPIPEFNYAYSVWHRRVLIRMQGNNVKYDVTVLTLSRTTYNLQWYSTPVRQ
jgi:hypothetical protein